MSNPRSSDVRGAALVVASACAYGTVPIFAKAAFRDGVSLPEFLSLRFAIAAALLWLAVAVTRSALPERRSLLTLFLMGALGYGLQSGAFFLALVRMPASTTALVLYTYPAIVTLAAAAFLHDRLTRRKGVAIAIAFVGTSLVVGGQAGGANGAGIAFALASAAIYSLYILFGSRVFAGVPPISAAATVMTGTATAFVIAAAAMGGLALPAGSSASAIIVAVGIVGTAIPVLAFLAGMPRIGPARAAILSTAEPVTTVLLAAALLGEPFRFAQTLGAACIVASVIVLEANRPAA